MKDKYGEKLEGFYLFGFFNKGIKSQWGVEKTKPFETDENGKSWGKCFCSHPTNLFADEWLFFETNTKIKDIHKDKELKKDMDDVWKDWLKKHKRKSKSLWEPEKPNINRKCDNCKEEYPLEDMDYFTKGNGTILLCKMCSSKYNKGEK